MAAAKKKTAKNTRAASGKKAPARTANRKKNPPARTKQVEKHPTPIEMTGLGIMALGAAALVTLLPVSGSGNFFSALFKGLGGYLSFTLPFIIMWVGLLIGFSNLRRHNVGQILKISSVILITFGMLQIFSVDEILQKLRLGSGWFNFVGQSYTEMTGGGAIGALICYPFYCIAGEWGGFALLIFALIGLIVLLRHISLQQMGQRAQEYLSENYEDFRQKQSQKSAERAIEREERKRAAQQREAERRNQIAQQNDWSPSWDDADSDSPAQNDPYNSAEHEEMDDFDDDYFEEDNTPVKPLNQNAMYMPANMRSSRKVKQQPAFGDPIAKPKAAKPGKKAAPAQSSSGRDAMHGSRKAAAPKKTPANIEEVEPIIPPFEAPVPVREEIPILNDLPVIEEETPLDLPADEPVYVCDEESSFEPDSMTEEEPLDVGDGFEPFPTFEGAPPVERERRRKEMNQPLAPLAPTAPVKKPDTPGSTTEALSEYNYPPVDLLALPTLTKEADRDVRDQEKARKLEATLHDFGINAKMTGIAHGPAVTRFELAPAPGVKVSRITSLSDDIALSLAALSVRIEAPIPGKAAVGVEIPNETIETVALREVLESIEARKHPSRIAVCMGKDNSGRYIVGDIAKMPHVLIAGATGSGKSVCINCVICSILYRATPDEVRLIMIDPKVVELSIYNGIPHLLVPVVTDPKKAAGALQWAVSEMTDRYNKFAERGVRDMKGYNATCKDGEKPLPQIVIIIDELADLMMVAPGEVEDAICRLAQLARAAGIHLVIATQRPSVNVITGVIKANIPARIAFTVSSFVDSRTILDTGGAEKLLGRGDMLFAPAGSNKMQRVQGAWVSDDEVHAIVDYIKQRHETDYNESVIEHMNKSEDAAEAESEEPAADDCDPLLQQAVEIVVEAGQASISMLQRRMRIGYARAGRLIDEMAARGIVSQSEGAKPRNVLINREQYHAMFHTGDA